MKLARSLQRLPSIPAHRYIFSRNPTRNSSASSAPQSTEEQIVIPNRIQRSSTDILQALASTVGRDPTSAHYKFHDDPYLIPTSNVTKRTFAMAQEAGRKAAKWIKEEHRDLFFHQEAQPAIAAFAPKMIFNDESVVDNSTLEQLILQSEVNDAIFVYNLMQQKNIPVDAAQKQSLLELICFYNNEQPLPEELIEERWFNETTAVRERQRKSWKDGDLAEKVFNEIEPKSAATYAAIIRGMSKYYQAERAYALLQEAVENQCELDTSTFNSIISVINFLKDSADERWSLCRELLQQMAQQQIKPDLGTLNSLLSCISSFGNVKFARSCALKVMAESKNIGIEPSLGTYYYLLIIFCRERGPVSHIIVDILVELKGKSFAIRDPKDTFFFATAMDVCRNHLHDKTLALKVNDLLHTGNNYDLLGDSYKESVYYRHYFALLCQTETIEEFMQTYDRLVPGVYIPEPGIMEEILKAVEVSGAVELMPRLWSDIVVFDHTNRESILIRTLKILVNYRAPSQVDELLPSKQTLAEQLAAVALSIYTKVEESATRVKKLSFTGEMLGDIMILLVRGGNYEKAVEVFANIDKNQHRIPGTPSEIALLEFLESCIANKAPSQAILCLQYAVENNMESLQLAKRINTGFTLNEVHLSKIRSLVGDGFLNE